MAQVLAMKGSKKLLNAWAFYDWANSVYSLVIASAIFPIFYGALFRVAGIEKVTIFGGEIARAPLISYVTSLAFVFIAIVTPLVSGIADYLGNKRVFLKFFCYLGAVSCIGLYWFSLENIYFGLVCYFFGLVGFWVSFAINNSYLPDIAFPEQQDGISAKGFSLGYIGSVILLVFNLAMVMKPDVFGITNDGGEVAEIKAMKYSFISVGIWWILFSQYTFANLPKGYKREGERQHIILNGFKELKSVWHQLGENTKLKRYLGAFFVYSMAVQTIMLIATYFGEEEIAWGSDSERTTGLIISIMVIQLVAIIGATVTAWCSKAFGNIRTLIVINIIWAMLCVYAYFLQTPMDFYTAAGFVGIVMGGIQALSRSTYSKFLPETTDTTSFFSFYDVAEKIGIIIGTFLYGVVAQLTGSMRNSTIFLGLFFIIGIFLLTRVKNKD
ncbi:MULTISPECIES: MFS transporter [Flagellimonas]|uniref:MFS transporter n=2 Tax=Flagellimonas TaxID=444459 RepID=A0A3A1NK97_9FLAO|nr:MULTISPECIES: MFS transporter [Allomuricauda]RIV45547.1 MFS transporter [Allomuricauda maritima]RIV69316.1 MFS transporter [Allomuricauda aequoris]TXJ97410.1 MFS transporter [Allomuricauda maritima]TXK00984.1 MFS transporter [Allomuricauda aequoris]